MTSSASRPGLKVSAERIRREDWVEQARALQRH